jgi:metal-sulfur cluster biosynthetic enzyme
MTLRAQVEAVLNTVIDPCSVAAGAPAGLVDMGLVSSLAIDERGEVDVAVRVTHPSCLMAPVFLAQVQAALDDLEGVTAVRAALDPSFDWTPANMFAAYRDHRGRRLSDSLTKSLCYTEGSRQKA